MQNNQMHKILIEVVQRTAPNKKSSESFQKKNKWSLNFRSSKQHDKWKLNQSRKSRYSQHSPKKSTPNHHTALPSNQIHQSSRKLPQVIRLELCHFIPTCFVAAWARPGPREQRWRCQWGDQIEELGTGHWSLQQAPSRFDGLRCTWGLYIMIYEIYWNMICVKSWCKLFFLTSMPDAYHVDSCFFFWTVRRSMI